jgi:multiple sugar transport system ATP-binding protein
VTHDQLEAMTLSTRTCLLKAGVVQQYAPPLEMYNNPTNIFAADFVGNPAINFIKGNVDSNNPESGTVIKAGGMSFVFHPRDKAAVKGLNPGDEVTIGVRPQYIRIEDNGAFKGRIYAALPSGMETIVRLHIGELLLSLVIFGADDYPVDAEVTVNFEGDCCILFDKKTGKSLGLGSLGAL